MPTKITYKSNPIATIRGQQTATIKCSGKKMTDDLVIETNEVATIDISDTTAIASDVLQGKEFYTAEEVKVEGTIPTIEATNREITTLSGVHYEQGYYNNAWDVAISQTEQAKIIPQNIKSGVDILGVTGILEEGGGSDITLNGVIEQYKVEAGETVNAGDFVEFVIKYGTGSFDTSASYISACKLNNQTVLVGYRNSSGYGTLSILNINDNVITVSTPYVFSSTSTYLSVTSLSETRALVIYGTSAGHFLSLLSIVDLDITVVATTTLNSYAVSSSYLPQIITINNATALCLYFNSSYLVLKKIIIDNDTLSLRTISDTNTKTNYNSLTKINDNMAVYCYVYEEDVYARAIKLDTNVVYSAVTIATPYRSYPAKVVTLDEETICVLFTSRSGDAYSGYKYYSYVKLATISGTTITAGSQATISISSSSSNKKIVALDENTMLVLIDNKAVVVKKNNKSLSVGTIKQYDTSGSYQDLIVFSSDSALAVYSNGEGAFKSLNINGTTITTIDNSGTNGVFAKKAKSRLHNVGVAKTSGSDGEYVDVYCALRQFLISTSLSNVTASAYSTTMSQLETQAITITANTGFLLPETITVTNATYTWDSATGIIVISHPVGDVKITIIGKQISLSAPTITLDTDTLTITDTSGLATSYDILVDGVVQTTISLTTFDMTILGLSVGTYSITVVAKADGYGDSVESNAISYVVEASGHTVTIYRLSGGNESCRYYDGQDSNGTYLGETGTFTVTSGYIYGAGYDQEILAPTTTGGVTLVSSSGTDGFSPTYLYSVTGDGTISGTWGCYIKGTKITLANGSTKNVEDIAYSDELLVWDFDKGDYATANPLWIKQAQTATYYYNIKFKSGDELKLVGNNGNCHRLYSVTDGEFVYANLLVGKEIYTQFGIDEVVSCEVINESVEFYNIITNYHMNCFANEVLTSCRYNNIYPIKYMKFVKDNREIIPFEAYDVPIEYYNGMRLGEQTIDIEKTNKYVSNLISLKDEK